MDPDYKHVESGIICSRCGATVSWIVSSIKEPVCGQCFEHPPKLRLRDYFGKWRNKV